MKEYEFTKVMEDMSDERLNQQQREIQQLRLSPIRPLEYVYSEGEGKEVTYSTDELVALCPATGYPDFYRLKISYRPDKYIPELKSLKFYIMDYYKIPIFHEHLAVKILNDFVEAVRPKYANIELSVAVRGGIGTTVTESYRR